jgi:3'5'-cyclic nucleotide phosphodiesterase
LSRVIKSDDKNLSSTAYGITTDPLTQFAIIFSALIHDVAHPGVSNAQLIKENNPMARKYNELSVAEQNSVTLAWDLLMQPRFTEFRNTIMSNEIECRQFRQLLVNSVMATDLFDKELKALRDNRWTTAFDPNNEVSSLRSQEQHTSLDPTDLLSQCALSDEDSNRRATIVIEHIIQASDVSHTMQHWHVYQKWNKRLFIEMYIAYHHGRCEKDPTIGWYDGELWFFDNYIIPLAKKLKTCGVFGVSCDELLDYAMENRAEWAAKGKHIVDENVLLLKDAVLEGTFAHKGNGDTVVSPVGKNSKLVSNVFDNCFEMRFSNSSLNDALLQTNSKENT